MTPSHDPDTLARFIRAQDSVYEQVLNELRRGRKTGHWMWFIFPQIAGLGFSEMARRYAISSLEEAGAYLQEPTLGTRLIECTKLIMEVSGKTALEIFGSPDDLKFRSSMTLFAHAASGGNIFEAALRKYFAGQHDPLTLERL